MKLNLRKGKYYKEIWKDIEGYEGLYQVSNMGNVRNSRSGRILKYKENSSGYLRINLYKNGKKMYYKVHRLVALTFISNTENKPCVDHINTIKNDNRVCNLRWVTYKENSNNELTIKHSSESQKGKILSEEHKNKISESKKGKYKGKDHPRATMVICITTGKIFNTIKEASEFYNIDSGHISACCNGKRKSAGKLNGNKLIWMYYKDSLENKILNLL